MPVARDSAALRDRIIAHFRADIPARLAVAVSGGSDSMALLHLLQDWSRAGGPEIRAVTVDHQLRPEAVDEARRVAAICRDLGVGHQTLVWQGWDGSGNTSDQARRARYALMAEWATTQDIAHIALGHTAEDQAETLLMRLARQAGLDGLAAMAQSWRQEEVTFHRPALGLGRSDLRDDLRRRGVAWVDDPSNEDDTYRRTLARQAMAVLTPLGVTTQGLAQVAGHLAEARRTLGYYASREASRIAGFAAGDVTLDRAGFGDLPPDIARRILQASMRWISGAGYGARGPAVERALADVRAGKGMTLHGCRLTVGAGDIRIAREYAAVAELRSAPECDWDGRWRLDGPVGPGLELRALGPEGRMLCPDWRVAGLPRNSIEAGPSVWRGNSLIAAPFAGLPNGWRATLRREPAQFHAMLLSH